MSTIYTLVETAAIQAPLERIFALSTRVELVQQTLGMTPSGGITTGHITLGARVHWRGWKFGLPTEHHTLITACEAPHAGRIGDPAAEFTGQQVAWFEDSQERGRFASFRHLHLFRQYRHDVRLEDQITYSLPFGPISPLLARFIVTPHIRKLTRQRFALLKQLAESKTGWQPYVEDK